MGCLWPNAGLTNRHIMSISGHRTEQSLLHYNRRPSTSQLKRCSNVLSEALGNETGHFDQHVVQRRRQVECLQTNSSTSSMANTTFNSQSSLVQIENLPNFGSLFSGCHIGNHLAVVTSFNQKS